MGLVVVFTVDGAVDVSGDWTVCPQSKIRGVRMSSAVVMRVFLCVLLKHPSVFAVVLLFSVVQVSSWCCIMFLVRF